MISYITVRIRVGRWCQARLHRLIRNTRRFDDRAYYAIIGRIIRDMKAVGITI